VLKQSVNKSDFLKVSLNLNGISETRLVHMLVCETFLGHAKRGWGVRVKHIDFDKWNNELTNLKITSNRESIYTTRKGTTSKYVGVCFNKANSKWKASIFYDGKQRTIGMYKTEHEAMVSYQNKLQWLLNNC